MTTMSAPVLSIELVPATCWWSNLRSVLTPEQWGRCKWFVRQRSGDRCELCRGRGDKWPVECHEQWAYDDKTFTQLLIGLIALCPRCHEAKHIGHANVTGNFERARRRLGVANRWTLEQVDAYIDSEMRVWETRSRNHWSADLTWLKSIDVPVPTLPDRPPKNG